MSGRTACPAAQAPSAAAHAPSAAAHAPSAAAHVPSGAAHTPSADVGRNIFSLRTSVYWASLIVLFILTCVMSNS